MAHDLHVSRQCYKFSRNVGNLINLLFFATKHFLFGGNPRLRRDYHPWCSSIVSDDDHNFFDDDVDDVMFG